MPLRVNATAPSELDANPRYLRLHDLRSRWLPSRRDVMVYLPEAYLQEPERAFPVFYLHDGQNVFDGRTSYVADHTWRAIETSDRLTAAGLMEPTILVGVANTGVKRITEYTPTRDARMGGGAGDRYGRLLVEELKPLVDQSFRTLQGPQHTGMGGSSLGGLITLALGLKYPEVFGRLAVMSPSVWWNQRSILNIVSEFKASDSRPRPRIWLDMGTAEGLRHLRDTDLLHRRLRLRGWKDGVDLQYLRVDGAQHNEDAWAARFDRTLTFLFPPWS
ncbi:esterase [Granulicella sp. 5B5]|uniref:alpha/beta hydrolase n=1 Tax=Granulicella sp. 5B5 TaxID=1617967 RepID=UPI0015F58AE1|nr:alpha/beta hydrolase-fold protein [Granulicella sp. 5B5]QMV20062.1 esterase [Granulicella sp. 5B5]